MSRGTFNQRGATLCARETQLPSARLHSCFPVQPPGSSYGPWPPPTTPLLTAFLPTQPLGEPQGAPPILVRVQSVPPPIWAAPAPRRVPSAPEPGAQTPRPLLAGPASLLSQTVLDFVPDWLACN